MSSQSRQGAAGRITGLHPNGHEDVVRFLVVEAADRDDTEAVVDRHHSQDSAAGVSMIRFKSQLAAGAALAALSLAGFCLSPANGAVAGAAQLAHPATGVGSCTLKNPDPKSTRLNSSHVEISYAV